MFTPSVWQKSFLSAVILFSQASIASLLVAALFVFDAHLINMFLHLPNRLTRQLLVCRALWWQTNERARFIKDQVPASLSMLTDGRLTRQWKNPLHVKMLIKRWQEKAWTVSKKIQRLISQNCSEKPCFLNGRSFFFLVCSNGYSFYLCDIAVTLFDETPPTVGQACLWSERQTESWSSH